METILLVDDDPGMRKSIGDILERSGYALHAAHDGNAIDLLETGAVDLMICDKLMPDMGGLMLVRRIKERWPDLPVVIMTGYDDLENYLCWANLGVVRYIGKSVILRELQQTVHEAIAEGL